MCVLLINDLMKKYIPTPIPETINTHIIIFKILSSFVFFVGNSILEL